MTKEQKNILESLGTIAEVSRSMSDAGPEILRTHSEQMSTALVVLNRKVLMLQEYTMRVFVADQGVDGEG